MKDKGTITACCVAALLIVLLIAVALPASADVAVGGTRQAPAGNSSVARADSGNSTLAGTTSRVSAGLGVGVGGIGPGSSGFDSWGWNLPGGIAAGPVRGYGGHGHGALWGYWSPYPGYLLP